MRQPVIPTDDTEAQLASFLSAQQISGNRGQPSWSILYLSSGHTYYWRIDEVNGTRVERQHLELYSAPYVNIDDFEDYNTTAELQAHWATTYL